MVKKKLLSLLIAAVMVLAMVPATAWALTGDEYSNTFNFLFDSSSSSNVEVAYSINRGKLTELTAGSEFTIDSQTPVVFYVKTADGYSSIVNIDNYHSKDSYAAAFSSGTGYSEDITDESYTGPYDLKNGDGDVVSFEDVTAEAREAGYTTEFHYSGYRVVNTYRKFIITANPIAVKVAYYNDENTSSSATDNDTYYHSNVSEYSNKYTITITSEIPDAEDGYAFVGWVLDDGDTETVYKSGVTVTVDDIWQYLDTSDTTTTAKFIAKFVKVDWNGLTIEKTADVETVSPGDTITYTIKVTNDTGVDLTGIKVSDDLDSNNLTLVSATSDEGDYVDGVWTISSLADGETATLTIVATVNAGVANGTYIENTATITDAYAGSSASFPSEGHSGDIKVLVSTYTVTFKKGSHGTLDGDTTITVTAGDTIDEVPDVDPDSGYKFVNWYCSNGKYYTTSEVEELEVTENLTFTAQYKKKTSGGSSYSLDETTGSSSSDDDDDEDYDSDIKLNTEEHFQYISGYPDGTVRPTANITRAEVATIFYRLLDDDTRNAYYSTYTTFDDVDSDQWYLKAIATLTNAGILHGDSDSNTFRPDDNITRAEFATIVSFFDEIVIHR